MSLSFPSIESGRRASGLALEGGVPTRSRPFAPWPSMTEGEIEAASGVLRSGRINYWTGEQCKDFEKEFAASIGVRHAVAVANGTVALELALHALDIGPDAEVIVPSRTFFASASCVAARGARPVFADVDPISQTITAETIREVMSPRTKGIIAVHLAGWPCDMDPILALARNRGIRVIEDCAQAQGATYRGRAVGCLGDIAAFSFCQDKIMSTGGEGGMVTTDDSAAWKRAWSYKDHGKDYDAASERTGSAGFRWLHYSFGTNWRLTEMQAAIGRSLLPKLASQLQQRKRNAALLTQQFSSMPALRVTDPHEQFGHAFYKYYAFLRPERLANGWTRERIIEAIIAEGVPCFSGSCSEVYLEKAVPEWMRPKERLPIARLLGETSLMFLVHPTLGERDMIDTARAVEKVLRVATLPDAESFSRDDVPLTA